MKYILFDEQSKKIGEAWKSLGDDEKQRYATVADEEEEGRTTTWSLILHGQKGSRSSARCVWCKGPFVSGDFRIHAVKSKLLPPNYDDAKDGVRVTNHRAKHYHPECVSIDEEEHTNVEVFITDHLKDETLDKKLSSEENIIALAALMAKRSRAKHNKTLVWNRVTPQEPAVAAVPIELNERWSTSENAPIIQMLVKASQLYVELAAKSEHFNHNVSGHMIAEVSEISCFARNILD